MSNDIQPNQPVTLSLHPDTQTIQQTGEKNVFANHVDNLNVTLQTLNTPPQLVTQAPKPATFSLNNEYYNLIVGGEMDFYNIQPFTLSIDRSLKEYMGDELVKEFNGYCGEMEGAAIAQVCKLDNIPFVIIRSISDKPNGKNEITFDEFLKKASKRCAYIIEKFFETL